MCAVASDRPGASVADSPTLIIVVVNWNGRHHLTDCLGSLLKNGYHPLHVVLVDNGSRDGSVPFVREAFPEVEVVELPENLRWAGGNNRGIRRALGPAGESRYLLLLNNDTVVPPGQLERLVKSLAAEPRAWAATPRICYANDPERIWYDGGRVGTVSGWIRHAGIRQPSAGRSQDVRFVDYGTGCALLLKEQAVRKVGELDEAYYLYGEDTDYCLRLRAAGGRILHVPRSLVLHKVSAALGGDSPQKAYLRSRSHVRLLQRHWPHRRWPLLIPCQLAYYGGLAAWHLTAGRGRVAWAALRGAVDELRKAPLWCV